MDLEVIESGNGGELVKTTKDLSVIDGLESMPYLALFGGNVKESTPSRRNPNQQAFDYWGNTLLMSNDPGIQFNSETERTLLSVALNSSGRQRIVDAIKKDLAFMKDFAKFEVSVTIIGVDKIAIALRVLQNVSIYLWDATNQELIDGEFVVTGSIVRSGIFDFSFDISFE